MSNVVVKQGTPSKSGEHVDTNAATVVPASSEVRTEAANREVAAQGKATRARIGELAKGMTGGKPAKAKAPKAKAAKGKAAAPKAGGGPSGPNRLTAEWKGKGGKDVKVKDVVKLTDGTTMTCIGRWTKRKGDKLIPMITGRVLAPSEGSPKKKGERRNAVAAEVTHTKK